ncbi:TonB-dependent receptor [Sphingobacterium sp. BIGb0165]|uniref:SusC/RagA family TonB-linked outer membrane protein n=1 Tax=Sphingobacterium sp. BIGb0165 TaxID=2940615 RepID=UPI002167F46A|nr:TonB-dependent receptor [Sphingobacterium sp. BIGb0165]MCS4226959.1 TonB-linked SusC/RagA family outer membrane protein [Sphingobacterium sp. BIGb0165]
MKKSRVLRYSTLFLCLSLGFGPTLLHAQVETKPIINASLTGKVLDSQTKQPIEGATVQLDAVTHSVKTDRDGNFQFVTGQKLPFTLIISYVGYKRQTIVVNTSPTVIALEPSSEDLDEVVVVGYGTQRKRDLTGASTNLNFTKDISGRPSSEIGQALYGQIAGVQVTTGSGKPGASASIQVRGINSVSAGSSPLLVVDGIPVPNYDLSLINNADIESIQVLKDAASAAIYGSRAANGVILITTKSGKSGRTRFEANYVTALQQVIDKVEVMNAAEYAQAAIDAAQNSWVDKGGDPNAPNTLAARGNYKYTWPEALAHPESLPNTDFQDVIFRTAPLNRLDINASGGNEKSVYRLSGGVLKRKGIALFSDYEKYALSFNIKSKITDWLEVGGNTNLNFDQEQEPYARMFEWAVQYPSIYPVYSENGYLGAPLNQSGFENYNAILFRPQNGHPLYRSTDDIRRERFNAIGNIYGQVQLIKGLEFKSAFNYYYNRNDGSNYQAKDHLLGPSYYTEGAMSRDLSRTASYTFQNLLTYNGQWEEHRLNALLGTEYNYSSYGYNYLERRGYDNDLVKALSAGKTVYAADDKLTKTTFISYFVRANYSYAGKYLLSASIRRDGSSRFAPNNKWGSFPAISAGWVASQEAFLQDIDLISNLKLRASYGLTGNDRFDDYKWIGQISQGRAALGNNLLTTYYPSSITNPNLQWERTRQYNIGLDLGLWNERLQLTVDAYQSKSDGLLLEVPVPVVSGFKTVFKNVGAIQNKGLEVTLASNNIKSGSFSWSSNLNFSFNRNKILSLGANDAPMILSGSAASGMQKINQVAQAAFSFFGYRYDGVYLNQAAIDADRSAYAGARPGDGRYKDIDANGVLNTDDRTIIGNPNPDFIYGFTNRFTYHNFDLSVVLQGVQGGEIMDENVHRSLLYHEGRNYLKVLNNRWRSEEDPGDGYHYRIKVDEHGYEKTPSSYWLFSASYFRLKDLTFGYSLSPEFAQRLKLSSLRIYFNGSNLFTKKDAPVFDPEGFSGNADDASRRGISANTYPSAKIYSIGLNLVL